MGLNIIPIVNIKTRDILLRLKNALDLAAKNRVGSWL